jgi:hypothetical protein
VRYFKILSFTVASFFGVFFFACSSGDSTGTSTGSSTTGGQCKHFDYSTYTPTSTTLTFMGDIAPLFGLACAASPACHMNGAHPPDLGTMADAATIRANIVGMNATEVPSMKYVVAGDPQNSWLMRKVEDANPGCGLMCTPEANFPASCSTQMPQIPPLLTASDQGKIRDWIKAGAKL